ncbi:glutathione S-transferase [Methylomonas sp. HYX-M1]|uniref:glutathione S-transferase n=1 Tax=Methylomonas sp. HYX-M1 TaxID=3139307 RepID=UPI00345BB106
MPDYPYADGSTRSRPVLTPMPSSALHSTCPIFYSFRRCPYAMRARLALASAGIRVQLREVALRNKPAALLAASAKGTVPVLVLADGRVIDESLDIMLWALDRHDPERWLTAWTSADNADLIRENDGEFKRHLDRYKYADRYPQHPPQHYRELGEVFLAKLENLLANAAYLSGERFGISDAAIAPFIRQFAAVDHDWFARSPYGRLRLWLQNFVDSPRFQASMSLYQPWMPDSEALYFPA